VLGGEDEVDLRNFLLLVHVGEDLPILVEVLGGGQVLHGAIEVSPSDTLNKKRYSQPRLLDERGLGVCSKIVDDVVFLLRIFDRKLMRKLRLLTQILQRDPLVHALLRLHANLVVLVGVVYQLKYSVEAEIAVRFGALVRLHLGVPTQVLVQVATGRETLGAEAALEWSVASVRSLMDHQIGLIAEALPTNFELCFLCSLFNVVWSLFSC
jgi:hypothetical protein